MSSRTRPVSIRSVRSLGVSGLLSPEGKVFHEIFYDAAGLGRSADLIAARLRQSKPDELSIHLLILMGVLGSSRVFDVLSPIRFECGMDEACFALSFSFELTEIPAQGWEGIPERIQSGIATSELDELLLIVSKYADHVVLKCETSQNRIEICTLNYWGKREGTQRSAVEVVFMEDADQAAVEVAEYTALGDLDYTRLLKQRPGVDSPTGPITGEVLVHQARTAEEILIKVRSGSLASEDADLVRVSGSAKKSDHEPHSEVAPTESDEPQKVTRKGRRGLFAWIANWGIVNWVKNDTVPVEEVNVEPTNAVTEKPVTIASGSTELQSLAKEFEKTFSEGFDKAVKELGSDTHSGRGERWAEGLLAELTAEKSRLIEMAKALTSSVRVKELEFKNRENSLLQSSREKDEALRVKTLQLMRTKDQLAKLQISFERAKFGSASADENALKYKYSQAQKLLQTARSEAETLRVRVEDLQSKVTQASEMRRSTVPVAVHRELERQVEKQARQLEELQKQKSPAGVDDLRRNLEIAQRVALQHKQKSEQMELVLQEQKIEIERLKQEMTTPQDSERNGGGTSSNAA